MFASSSISDQDDYVDVEFERVDTTNKKKKQSTTTTTTTKKKKKQRYTDDDDENDDNDSILTSLYGKQKNLIDVSFDTGADEIWSTVPVPFTIGNEYIDCKVAFMIDYDGQTYGIGIPYDDAVALITQEEIVDDDTSKKNKSNKKVTIKTTNIDPELYSDNEEYAELMEIFATKVQEEFGKEYQLKKTPKVLTISGGLDKITKDWEKVIVPDPVGVDELLKVIDGDDSKDETTNDKEVDEFIQFMREELGDEEVDKTLNGQDNFSQDDLQLLDQISNLMGTDTGRYW